MTMIEKVARASFNCWRKRMTELGHHMDKGQTFEDMSDSERDFAFMNARAMIEAMREPTEGMLSVDYPDMPAGGSILEIYQDMIDAALKE